MRKLFPVRAIWSMLLICASLIQLTCTKDEVATETQKEGICEVKDPLTDLVWLKNIINSTSTNKLQDGARIFSYRYNGAYVFYISNPASSTAPKEVYNCKGEIIISHTSPPADWEAFTAGRSSELLLWSKTICGTYDPVYEFAWLKNIVNSTTPSSMLYGGARVYSDIFKGNRVFYITNPGSTISTRNVYTCSGNLLISSSAPQADWEEFRNTKTAEILLYSKPICGVADPFNEHPVLKKVIEGKHDSIRTMYSPSTIHSFLFRGEHVFYIYNPASSRVSESVLNCKGDLLMSRRTQPADADWQAFENERTQEVLLGSKGICGEAGPIESLPWVKNLINSNALNTGARIFFYIIRSDVGPWLGGLAVNIWNPGSPETVYSCIGNLTIGPSSTQEQWDHFRKQRRLETLLWSKD